MTLVNIGTGAAAAAFHRFVAVPYEALRETRFARSRWSYDVTRENIARCVLQVKIDAFVFCDWNKQQNQRLKAPFARARNSL